MNHESEVSEDTRALIAAFRAGCVAELQSAQEAENMAELIVQFLEGKGQKEMIFIIADLLLLYCGATR